MSSRRKSRQTSAPEVTKTTLPSGLRVVTERMRHVRSVSVGVWVDSGSRDERPRETGICHFIEHMLFKGTHNRSAEEIACSVDAIGGHLDAFTMKETVAFTAKVLDEHTGRALDVLSDLVLNPLFREEDIVREKKVVLEELKMDEDNPEYLIHEMFSSNFWKGHGMGRPIIGSKQTITGFGRGQLQRFFRKTYQPSNLIITAAGNLRHDDFVKLVEPRFRGLECEPLRRPKAIPKPRPTIVTRDKRSLEQVHLCLGVPTFAMRDAKRYAGYVLNTVLGGGVSSRLFLKIREHEGLAYSVFSDLSLYSDTGCLSVYAGTSLSTIGRVIEHVMGELRRLKQDRVAPAELERAKDHLKGNMMLSLESTGSRMSNLARQEKYFQKFISLDQVRERIERVTSEQVRRLAQEWFHQQRVAVAVLGNLNGFAVGREQLAC